MSQLISLRNSLPKLNQILNPGFQSVLQIPARNVWGNVNTRPPRGKFRPNKHKDPRFGKLRGAKVLKIDLPDMDFQRRMQLDQVTPEERRSFMKRMGMFPAKNTMETQFFMASTGAVFDPYVPPEGDGRSSLLSKEGAKERMSLVTGKGKSLMATRKLKKYDEDFSNQGFIDLAQDIYIKAHEALAKKEEKRLHELATEKLYPEMVHNTESKTIHWDFIKSLEPARIVHIRVVDILSKENKFAQITVRFHSQQILAVYDRFGRLIHGSPVVAKDVLEYVVFEKHLSSIYGTWRMHTKIIPDWLAHERPGSLLTQVLPKESEVVETPEVTTEVVSPESTDKEENVVYDAMGRKI